VSAFSPRFSLFFALLVALVGACSNPCDQLVDKRCDCGPEACRAARDEQKLTTELVRGHSGASARELLVKRCKGALEAFRCTKN